MPDTLYHRRHRFDALFAMLTGRGTAYLPQNAPRLRDVGLPETTTPIQPSRTTLMALADRPSR